MSHEFGLIAADTSRTRAYLTAMESRGLLPAWVLLLDADTPVAMPGQAAAGTSTGSADADWPEANFDPVAPLIPWLERLNLPFAVSGSCNINDPGVVELIAQAAPEVLVYSGYGGALLRDAVLATGKSFLHVHGGYLPEFKGSTTNYFSLLAEGAIGASAIFLTQRLTAARSSVVGVSPRRRCAPTSITSMIQPPAQGYWSTRWRLGVATANGPLSYRIIRVATPTTSSIRCSSISPFSAGRD